jgi:5'-3' exonuclease
MVIVDFNGMAVGSIMGQLNRGEPLSEGLVKHIVLNNLRMYRQKYPESKYGNMVIACDSYSWRKDVYPEYKASRKTKRDTDKIDWKAIYAHIDTILQDLRENFPYAVIRIDNAEADDIIGALTIHKSEPVVGENVVIVSADKDFIQLQAYGHVIQWSPMFQKMLKEADPTKYIFEHIMKGDSCDGVPNVMSPDNSFTDKIRQTPMRMKLINEWWEHRDDLKAHMPEECYRNYMRNREMIDLHRTPEVIKSESVSLYENYKYSERSNILTYLVENQMKLLVECAGEF